MITAAEKTIRVQKLANMIINGATRPMIISYCQKEWNITPRTVDRYIIDAKDFIKTIAETDIAFRVAQASTRFDDLYMKSYKAQDFKECRAVTESLLKLLGANAPEKKEILGKFEGFDSFMAQCRTLADEEFKSEGLEEE